MPKAYLRYKGEGSLGAIVSQQGNVVVTGNSSSSSGRYIFCPTNDSVTIWDIKTQTIKGIMEIPLGKDELQKRPPQVTALSNLYTPNTTSWHDAKIAVGYSDGSIRIFSYDDHQSKPGSVDGIWSPDVCFIGHRSAVNVLKFSRGGFQLCSGGADNDVIVWDVVAETGMCRLSGHKDQVTDLALLHETNAPDASLSYVVSVSKDTTCKVWSIGTQICVQTYATGDMMKFIGPLDRGSGESGLKKRVGTLAFTYDGSRLLAQAVGRTIEIYDMLTEKYRKRVQRRKREKAAKKHKTTAATATAAGPDGVEQQQQEAAAAAESQQQEDNGEDGTKPMSAAELYKLRDKLLHLPGKIGSMAIYKDTVCVGLLDNSLHLTLASEESAQQPIYGICDDPDVEDNFITVGADKTLRYYSTDMSSIGQDESSILIEDDSKRLTLNDDGLCVALSPKDKKKPDAPRFLAIGLLDSTITVVYADTGKQFLTLYGHQLPVLTVAFSDDGQLLASGSADKNIKLWHPKFGNCLRSLRAHESSVTSITWLPGTHYLASVGKLDGLLKLWDCDRSEEIASLPGHNGDVWSVACDADGALIATGGADRSIRLWKRTDEQMFIEEEQEEALDRQLEEDAAREAAVVTMARPTRRTMDTVKSAERLMEALDEVREATIEEEKEGEEEEKQQSTPEESIKTLRIMAAIPVADMQEVVLALPVTYSKRLLSVLVELLSFLSQSVPKSQQAAIRGGLPIELCLSVGLSLIQAQAPYLVHDPTSRRLLVHLRDLLYDVASTAVDEAGVARAAAIMAREELKRRREIGDLDAEDRAYRKSRRIAGGGGAGK
ncbi:Dip2/Utp12 protein [Perkinsus chesapeaki]|uniref:Dip2/Utp12 protein n=1 Tax=Perkinsus chesapeaki TaxID=330153 RepID=A0A7J6MLL7_PERCH|nr:Dip2/Utp12 protein [Perkinsus chesapeaki]